VSYALRNSIVLGLLLALLLGGGYYWIYVRQPKQRQALQAEQQRLNQQIASLSAVLATYDSLLAQLAALETRWQQRRWVTPETDTPDQTLAYLDSLVEQTDRNINFDFEYKGTKELPSYSYNTYTLRGEASFRTLYAFLWLLEHGTRLYTVERLQIDAGEEKGQAGADKAPMVGFAAVLRAFFTPGMPPSDSLATPRPYRPALLESDVFMPLISKTLPENTAGLPDVFASRLTVLTHDTAYLLDREGQTHALRVGDPVYLGRLEAIDIYQNRAVFVLNKGGIWEWVTLRVESGAGDAGH